jgi:drug/metabolite transporter (DMT)-like permease
MPERSAPLVGIGLMLLAVLMFSLNDTLGKWLVVTYSVGQILLIRSAASLLLLAPFAYRAGLAPFRTAPRRGLQLLRMALGTAEVACFYAAVWYMPLADAMTFYLAGPIYVTALSALFLGEKVGLRRWAAVLVGFVGVLIAMQPTSSAFSAGAPIALAGSILYAFFMIVTRYLRETSDVVYATSQAGGSLLFGAVAAPLAWTPIAGFDLALLSLLGVVSISAIVLVNQSLRLAPASVVVPYQYTLIVWAVIFGYIFFGDVAEAHTLAGAAIIIGSGLFIFLREQRLARPEATQLGER